MASFAVRYLDAGETLHHQLLPHREHPRPFTALPPRMYDMYNPGAWADGGAQVMTVK